MTLQTDIIMMLDKLTKVYTVLSELKQINREFNESFIYFKKEFESINARINRLENAHCFKEPRKC